MVYRSGFEGNFGLGALSGAVVPASIAAAAIGVFLNGAIILLLSVPEFDMSPAEFLLVIIAAGIFMATAVIAGSFVVAFYLVLFGLPVALLLGGYIRHPFALAVALLDAAIAAIMAVSGSFLRSEYEQGFPWVTLLQIACFALPAGYLYRRNVIAMRDEAELFA